MFSRLISRALKMLSFCGNGGVRRRHVHFLNVPFCNVAVSDAVGDDVEMESNHIEYENVYSVLS
jgi:hypothetical protein